MNRRRRRRRRSTLESMCVQSARESAQGGGWTRVYTHTKGKGREAEKGAAARIEQRKCKQQADRQDVEAD